MPLDDQMLQDRLDVHRDKHGVPGASLAVLSGHGVSAAASGILNLATGVTATIDSLFQIGSITKVWTATVILQLVAEGRVDLDDAVRAYLPSFRVADESVSSAVTVRHLLTHTSGIDGDNFADTGRGDDALERYIDTCAGLHQVHPLDATMSYCNTGFSVLGRIIEVITGSVWDDVMRARLYQPLGLRHTATLPEDVLRFRAAMGHIQPPGQELEPAPVWMLPRSAGPAGLICASATDLLEFARWHLTDEGIAPAMREAQAVMPGPDIGTFSTRRGLGWALYDWDGRDVVGHDGGTIGQSAFLRVVPDVGVAVALLTNGGNATGLFHDVVGEVLTDVGLRMPPPPTPAQDPPSLDDPGRYVGTYERAGSHIDVVRRGADIVAVQTVTGPGAAMTPDPFEMPLIPHDPALDLFLTRHPAAPGMWLPAMFLTLPDGCRSLHVAGRATPRVD